MNPLLTLIRHLITAIAGLGAFIATYDPAAATPGVPVDPLAAVSIFAAIALTRWVLALLGKFLEWIDDKTAGGNGPGLGVWLLLAACTAVGLGALPSCSSSSATLDALRSIPVRIGIQGDTASASYSSDTGLEVRAVIRSSGK